jgi:tRNA(Ile)-lysidine synthase
MAASRNRLSPDLPARVGAVLAGRIGESERLGVGLSGGCDSVVLLHALVSLGFAGRLTAIHVHHGLSPNANAWADFCAGYCERLGVPLIVKPVAVDRKNGLGIEASARQSRYAAFAECPVNCLLLAQHRGDQAETLLFNLLRGAGVTGAAAMPVERGHGTQRVVRPLLEVSRHEIEAYARANDLRWIEDESNADTAYSRNFLRHEAMPLLSSRFRGVEAAFAQSAAHFAEAASLLDELAETDWQAGRDGESFLLSRLRELSLPRLKNLLRYRLRRLGWQVPVASRLEEFSRQLQSAGPDRHPELVLPDGVMRAAKGRLHWLASR